MGRAPIDRLRGAIWRARDLAADFFNPRHREEVFTRIYDENLWGSDESPSGTGSTKASTGAVVERLPSLWQEYGIRSLVDAPCGDCNWMSRIAPLLDSYVGVDIIPRLIEANRTRYPNLSFRCGDLTCEALPAADAIHCRDCFQHLPTSLILSALRNFEKSGARWLFLTTNSDIEAYDDVVIGGFRPINFLRPPFNFPKPHTEIAEDHCGRSLALWDLHQRLASRFNARPGSEE